MIYYLYRWGMRVGLSLIILVSTWDILTKGGLGCLFVFWRYSIGFKGVAILWLGIFCILGSIWAERKVKVGSMWNYKYIPGGVIPR